MEYLIKNILNYPKGYNVYFNFDEYEKLGTKEKVQFAKILDYMVRYKILIENYEEWAVSDVPYVKKKGYIRTELKIKENCIEQILNT